MNTRAIVSVAVAATLLASTMTLSADEQRMDQKQDDDQIQNHGHDNSSDQSRVRRGFAISPVQLSLRKKNIALVGLGSYLVNAAGGCNDCHTRPSYLPGGDPFQGQPPIINAEEYLTGGRQFGPFTSANLTPDEDGRPAGLTWEEFQNVIRTGRDPDDPSRILQVMPWPVYLNLTDRDLRAIYEFLRAIPSRPDNPNPGP
jgi:hypothetical protein